MVITQLARFGGEAEVGNGGKGERARLETFGPLVLRFVKEVDF